MARCQQDLIGHGTVAPAAEWPNGEKIAVQIVSNYEEDGENSILDGDAASEPLLSGTPGGAPGPGKRHGNMTPIDECGAHAGFRRVFRLLQKIPVSVERLGKERGHKAATHNGGSLRRFRGCDGHPG